MNADQLVTSILYMVCGSILVFLLPLIVSEPQTEEEKGFFLFMMFPGVGLASFGFIYFMYHFFKTLPGYHSGDKEKIA